MNMFLLIDPNICTKQPWSTDYYIQHTSITYRTTYN